MTAAFLLETSAPAPAAADAAGPGGSVSRIEGELLVRFRDGAGARSVKSNPLSHTVRRRFDRFGWQHIILPPGLTVDEALERYRSHPDILAAEPNLVAQAIDDLPGVSAASAAGAAAVQPDDPLLSQQWALARVGAPNAWLNQTGASDIVVAVVDTGVNYLHEDLAGNVWRNPGEIPGNGIDDDRNGWIDDVFGIDTANDAGGSDSDPFDLGAGGYRHGTLVAGIIGAAANNGRGIAGINWSIRIMAVRAIRSGNLITTADELEALHYVLVMRNRGVNVRAVNLSYGGLPYSTAERDALAALADAGLLLCAAAGNSGANNDVTPNYPSCHPLPGIIAVAASDELDHLAEFPSGGSSHYGRTNVDLAAPGIHIASTSGPETNAYHTGFLGTSAAAPHVTGAVALLAAANPDATPQQIKRALIESVDVTAALTNRLVSNGRLNIGRAIDHPHIASGPPVITNQPISQSVRQGDTARFSAGVSGPWPLFHQWSFNGNALAAGTNATLTIAGAQLAHDGVYRLTVSNRFGSATSDIARLTVLIAPAINVPPISQSVVTGGSVTLSVGFNGNPPPFGVQWLRGTTPRASNTVAGRLDFYTLPNVQPGDAGTWRVRVRNAAGASGAERSFTIQVLSDADGDGLPDAWELAHGFGTNTVSDALLDADGDGQSNRDEYIAGTNPTNALSRLAIVSLVRSNASAALGFTAASNKTYTVERCLVPGETPDWIWSGVADVPAGATNRSVTVSDPFDPSGPAARLYRIVTPRTPGAAGGP